MTIETTVDQADAVLEAIRSRRSNGRVLPEMPPRALIERVIEAGTYAPNHRLTEPWRFIVLTGGARTALGHVLAGLKAGGGEAEIAKERAKPLRAPVLIAVAAEPATGPKVVESEEIAAVAAAAQNMLLAAHALGLAAIWRTGDPCYSDAVREHLGLRQGAHVLGFIYLGYPDPSAPPARSSRRPAAELTVWRD